MFGGSGASDWRYATRDPRAFYPGEDIPDNPTNNDYFPNNNRVNSFLTPPQRPNPALSNSFIAEPESFVAAAPEPEPNIGSASVAADINEGGQSFFGYSEPEPEFTPVSDTYTGDSEPVPEFMSFGSDVLQENNAEPESRDIYDADYRGSIGQTVDNEPNDVVEESVNLALEPLDTYLSNANIDVSGATNDELQLENYDDNALAISPPSPDQFQAPIRITFDSAGQASMDTSEAARTDTTPQPPQNVQVPYAEYDSSQENDEDWQNAPPSVDAVVPEHTFRTDVNDNRYVSPPYPPFPTGNPVDVEDDYAVPEYQIIYHPMPPSSSSTSGQGLSPQYEPTDYPSSDQQESPQADIQTPETFPERLYRSNVPQLTPDRMYIVDNELIAPQRDIADPYDERRQATLTSDDYESEWIPIKVRPLTRPLAPGMSPLNTTRLA